MCYKIAMASSEHLNLANLIKKVHQNLRLNTEKFGFREAWKKHCEDADYLNTYAAAMKQLATQHWENNYKNSSKAKCRVQWIFEYYNTYFLKGGMKIQRKREEDIATKLNIAFELFLDRFWFPGTNLKLLDVGSCYNPFKVYKDIDVTALDLSPGSDDVYQCDFLDLKVLKSSPTNNTTQSISELQKCSFDIIVFSLLLEYLPCPDERYKCCSIAYNLLKFEGLLMIVTPDSKHVSANSKFIKSWRYVLAELGFCRIKYEKLDHIHCMAFRKNIMLETAKRWCKFQDVNRFFDKMFIPQDFQPSSNDDSNCVYIDVKEKMEYFSELPIL